MQPIAELFKKNFNLHLESVKNDCMDEEKEVTIYDIATRLNLSPATISRGLKDYHHINKLTKKKINDAAKEMGYRSNSFASNLRKKRSNTIGVIVPRLNSYFMSGVLAGMENVAQEAGYNLIISQSLETFKKEKANADTFFNSRVDGLLISFAYDTQDIKHLMQYINKKIPVVFFDRIFDSEACTGILIDNKKAAYEITKHLIDQGCKNMVHITASTKLTAYKDRLEGFKMALAEFKLPFKEVKNLIINNLGEVDGIAAAEKIMKMKPRPDAVFSANDSCAVSCMIKMMQEGIKIPDDIAFAGFNNDPISRIIQPNLTTINYPAFELGEVAVRSLIHQLDGASNINSVILKSEMLVRESSMKKNVLIS